MIILSFQTLNGLSGVTVSTEVLNDAGEEVKSVNWGAVETILKQKTLINSSYK